MINSTRSKIVLIFLMFVHSVTPMMRLPDVKSIFYDETEQNIFAPVLMIENYLSLGTLAFQAALFILLKKNNNLFGTELIPKVINMAEYPPIRPKHAISASAFFGLIVTAMSSAINRAPQVCIHSGMNTGINTLLLTSSMMHISNLIYNDVLKVLKKKIHEVSPPQLILKQTLDTSILSDVRCLMCLDDTCTCGYVNLCNKQDHIFCKDCLISWFNEVRQRSNFVNKYRCELCTIEVPRNDEKFEITLPPEPHVTFGLWFRQIGLSAFFYCLGLYVLVNLMQCQFS